MLSSWIKRSRSLPSSVRCQISLTHCDLTSDPALALNSSVYLVIDEPSVAIKGKSGITRLFKLIWPTNDSVTSMSQRHHHHHHHHSDAVGDGTGLDKRLEHPNEKGDEDVKSNSRTQCHVRRPRSKTRMLC